VCRFYSENAILSRFNELEGFVLVSFLAVEVDAGLLQVPFGSFFHQGFALPPHLSTSSERVSKYWRLLRMSGTEFSQFASYSMAR